MHANGRSEHLSDSLTIEQIRQFQQQGFLVIETPQIGTTEIEWCQEILTKLIEEGVGSRDGRNFDLAARDGGADGPSPQILRPSLYATDLRKLSCRKATLAWAKQLLGPEASFVGDLAILKPGHNGGATPWHQTKRFVNRDLIIEKSASGSL